MKLSGRALTGVIDRPDPGCPGYLLYGEDAMRVALKRQALVKALLGDGEGADMRLTRMTGNRLRSEPGLILDEMTAQGFFAGPRVVFVEEVNETATEAAKLALDAWQPGDAVLVLTGGALKTGGKLRKLFEGHPTAAAVPIYDDPMDRAELERALRDAGLGTPDRAVMAELETLSRALDPGDMAQTLEKIALYKHGDDTPLTLDEIAALAPATTEAALDDLLHAVAEGEVGRIGPLMTRLTGQGGSGTAICIAATRHFRQLYAAACDPRGAAQGLASQRPPVFWKHRDRMARQAGRWGEGRLARALGVLVETDLALRGGSAVPDRAAMERTLIRLAMLAQARS